MYISLFGCQNLGAHACKPVWISFWIRHWALLSILSKIRYLICHSNLNWLLNLSLIYKTLGWGRKWLIDFNAGNMDGSVFEEKLSFKILGVTFSSKLDWGTYIISIAKTASKKIGAFSMNFNKVSFSEVAVYLYKSTIHPCNEYCCHVWAAAPSCCLELLDKLKKQIWRTIVPLLAACLKPWLIVKMAPA